MTFNTIFVATLAAMLMCSAPAEAREYQRGTCSVRENATGALCVPVRGASSSRDYPGKSHDACTEAKALAREALLGRIPAECGAFISCGKPCKRIDK